MAAWILLIIAAVLLFGAATVCSAIRGFLVALGVVALLIAVAMLIRSTTGSDALAFVVPVAVAVAVAVWAKMPRARESQARPETGWSTEEQLRLAQGTTRADLEARSKRS